MIGSKRAYLSRSRRAITCVSNYGIQFELLGPVHTYPDIFESATFFPDTATVHTYPPNSTANPEKKEIRSPKWKKLYPQRIR